MKGIQILIIYCCLTVAMSKPCKTYRLFPNGYLYHRSTMVVNPEGEYAKYKSGCNTFGETPICWNEACFHNTSACLKQNVTGNNGECVACRGWMDKNDGLSNEGCFFWDSCLNKPDGTGCGGYGIWPYYETIKDIDGKVVFDGTKCAGTSNIGGQSGYCQVTTWGFLMWVVVGILFCILCCSGSGRRQDLSMR